MGDFFVDYGAAFPSPLRLRKEWITMPADLYAGFLVSAVSQQDSSGWQGKRLVVGGAAGLMKNPAARSSCRLSG